MAKNQKVQEVNVYNSMVVDTIKEMVDLAVGVGMSPAHKAVTNHANFKWFGHGDSFSLEV